MQDKTKRNTKQANKQHEDNLNNEKKEEKMSPIYV